MQEWYQQTVDRQKELGITVLGSNSTVAMQDETFPACKIEFWRAKESELESVYARKRWGHFPTKSFNRGKNCTKFSDPWPCLRRERWLRQCLSANGNYPGANPAHMGLKVQCVHLVLRCGSGLCNASWPNLPLGSHVYVGKITQYWSDQKHPFCSSHSYYSVGTKVVCSVQWEHLMNRNVTAAAWP